MSERKSISRSNLTDQVTHEITGMILRGEVSPGDWLMPQPDLAQRFGVGLSTVREAVKGLALLGIVDPQPGRGTHVADDAVSLIRMLDLQQSQLETLDLATTHEARRVLEVELTALAAERATAADLAVIRAALDRMAAAMDDDEAFMRADADFHKSVARAAHNTLLEQFYHVVSEMMDEINISIADVPGVKDLGFQMQEQIYEAIAAHQVQIARRRAYALVNRWRGILRAVSAMPAENAYPTPGG